MRLQEIYHICKTAYNNWPEMSFEDIRVNGLGYYKLTNPQQIKVLLDSLSPVDFLNSDIIDIYKTAVGFGEKTGLVNYEAVTRNRLLNQYGRLKMRVGTIVDFFNSINYCQESEGFDIKLPPDISLLELSKCAKDLDKIFSTCPLLTKEDGTIELKAVDVGSIWLTFVIVGGAVGIINMLASLVDKALVIRSHYLTSKQQEEQVRSLGMANDFLESYIEANKRVEKELTDKVCAELAQENGVTEPEDKERLKYSLQLLADWQKRGMEIYPSIQSAQEVKAVFPPLEMQTLPTDSLKLLLEQNQESEP